jgi:hypothetical protein
MESRVTNWAGWMLVVAAVSMMFICNRLDLLMIVLPAAVVFAYATTRVAGRSGQHRI